MPASRVQHPLNINPREDAVIGRVNKRLAREFAPHPMSETLRARALAKHLAAGMSISLSDSGPAVCLSSGLVSRSGGACEGGQ
jgi:hypothetical protein